MLSQGAEAILIKEGNKVVKIRQPKDYRIAEVDLQFRKQRTRREAKVIQKLAEAGIPVPTLFSFCDKEMRIEMEFLAGKKLRDCFEENPIDYAKEVGKLIARIHNLGIIHGDLTTSNMILKDNKIHLIDFGLSFFSHKVEDKAVDLHLFRQALESKHYTVWQEAFRAVLESYAKHARDADLTLKRLEKVEKRGRHKQKAE